MQIEIDNQTIHYLVQYTNSKKMAIQIDPSGLVTVKAPKQTSEQMIAAALRQHSQLILAKMAAIAQAMEQPKKRDYQEQGIFLHLGQEYLLHELIEIGEWEEDQLKARLKKFYYASCAKIVGERIKIYQAQLKVKPKSVEVVESANKWGSCSSDKKLTFNYRLVMAPIEVIDYVVIHELCHILHMNHDRSFWRRVGSMMPDYKEKEAYLARQGVNMTL